MTVETLRPDGDVTCSLTCSTGTSHFALVDEAVLDTADYVYKTSTPGVGDVVTGSDLLSCGTFTKTSSITKVDAKFYIGLSVGGSTSPGTATCTLALYTGATLLASALGVVGWNTVTYTGNLTQSEIDGLRMYAYFSVSSGYTYNSESKVTIWYTSTGTWYDGYLEVTYWPYVTIDAAVMEATTSTVSPTVLGKIHVSVTGLPVMAATCAAYECDFSPTLITGVPIMTATGEIYAHSLCLFATIQAPRLKCICDMFDDYGLGTATIAAPIMTCTGMISSNNVTSVVYHSIYQGSYFTHHTYPNRIYVVGKDTLDNIVYGEAKNSTHISEYGEVLKPVVSPLITTSALATTTATLILSKGRLETVLGEIVVPPNCGMEIGDVIQIRDIYGNQTTSKYRVMGYKFIYDPTGSVAQFKHTIQLTEV